MSTRDADGRGAGPGARDFDARARAHSLAGVPMLAGLAADLDRGATPLDSGPWADLAASAEPISVRAGEWLFRQGDPGESLYVVLTGRLRGGDRGRP